MTRAEREALKSVVLSLGTWVHNAKLAAAAESNGDSGRMFFSLKTCWEAIEQYVAKAGRMVKL